MREEIFSFFNGYYIKDLPKGFSRLMAVTNEYFLVAKECGLVTDEAMQILDTTVPFSKISLKNLSRHASRYVKALNERGVSFEKGLGLLDKVDGEVDKAIRLINQRQEQNF